MTKLEILRRQDWGAKAPRGPYSSYSPRAVIWHHTYSPGCGVYPPSTEAALCRMMQSSHIARGWGDIGQHFTVFQSGRVYEGRPLSAKGVHAAGANSWTIGIEHQGDFHTSSGCSPTELQIHTSAKLIARLFLQFRWPTSRAEVERRVLPHRAVTPTACPGDRGIKALVEVRDLVVFYTRKGKVEMSRDVIPISFSSERPQVIHIYLGKAYDRQYIPWLHIWRLSGPSRVRFHVSVFPENAPSLGLEHAVDRRWFEFGTAGATWSLADIYSQLKGNYLVVFTAEPSQPAFEGTLETLTI